jgi:hypothetical protein
MKTPVYAHPPCMVSYEKRSNCRILAFYLS